MPRNHAWGCPRPGAVLGHCCHRPRSGRRPSVRTTDIDRSSGRVHGLSDVPTEAEVALVPSTEAPGDLEGVSTPTRDRAGQLGVPRVVEVELVTSKPREAIEHLGVDRRYERAVLVDGEPAERSSP